MTDREMLEAALEEARAGLAEGGIPIGAALFAADGTLLGRGHNRRVQDDDASVHAETDAFRRAGRRRGYRDTVMVTTLAPCWYCSGLVRQFGISKVVVGESVNFAGGIDWLRQCGVEVVDLTSDECIRLLGGFIEAHPELWHEDIGGPAAPARRAVVVPYDDAWPARAAALIGRLRSSLGPNALRIDHIGSTAIPGMAAKDVLDLQVSVADLDDAARRFDAPLAAEGFTRLPYDRDHVPAGIVDDPARWAKRLWARREHPDGAANLHVRLAGSPNERLALLFRDWMRAHPAAVSPYAAFKLALARAVGDLYPYTEVKDPVVDLLMTVAEPWALETGWTP